MRCVTLASIIILAFAARAVSQQEQVTLHVTSVEQGEAPDYCTTGKCNATKVTVEGFTHDKDGGVKYVLECVEVIASETNAKSVACFRVHAHADYRVFGSQPTTETFQFLFPSISSPDAQPKRASRIR
jgi:hypothetical protein